MRMHPSNHSQYIFLTLLRYWKSQNAGENDVQSELFYSFIFCAERDLFSRKQRLQAYKEKNH